MREVRMPQIALGDEEMTVVAWHKQLGELVDEGEPLLEVETEKASMDVEAPFAACRTFTPRSTTSRTASALNSRLNARLPTAHLRVHHVA